MILIIIIVIIVIIIITCALNGRPLSVFIFCRGSDWTSCPTPPGTGGTGSSVPGGCHDMSARHREANARGSAISWSLEHSEE